jgi:hypothetical protein
MDSASPDFAPDRHSLSRADDRRLVFQGLTCRQKPIF